MTALTNAYPVWLTAIHSLLCARARTGRPIRGLPIQPSMHRNCGVLSASPAPAAVVDTVYAQGASLRAERDSQEREQGEQVVLHVPAGRGGDRICAVELGRD